MINLLNIKHKEEKEKSITDTSITDTSITDTKEKLQGHQCHGHQCHGHECQNNYYSSHNYEDILDKFVKLKERSERNNLSKMDYLKRESLTNYYLKPHIETYIASFSENRLKHTPKTIKKALLCFFPEMYSFFKKLEDLYPGD